MCCECGGGCAGDKRITSGSVTEEACPATCVFSTAGCGEEPGPGPEPVEELWEVDFGTCDVTKYETDGTTVDGQDD